MDSEKIVKFEEADGKYRIPLHEFTKHALLGEYAYFNSQSSLVACNVYDLSMADPREHFLASLLVAFLSSNIGTTDNDGFVRGQIILTEMQNQGFVEDQVVKAMRRLAVKRLIETPHAHYREIEVTDEEIAIHFHFRATSIGLYHIRFWAGSFAFLDAVSTDTPIFDEESRAYVSNLAASFSIADRYKKAEKFRQYLESQWSLANFAANYYDFSSLADSQSETFRSVENAMGRRR